MNSGFSLSDDYIPHIIEQFITGSRVIGGATEESDYDICVLAKPSLFKVLMNDGWNVQENASEYDASDDLFPFYTTRRGKQNLIVYEELGGFDLFYKAHRLAIELKAADKEVRVNLFKHVCSGTQIEPSF